MVLVLLLFCVALWLVLRGDLYCLALRFVLVVFSPLSIAITSLGEEKLVCAFFMRLFVLRVMVCVPFLFLLVSGIDCDL